MIDLRRWTEQLTEIRTTLEAASRGCLLVVATTDAALEQDLAGVLAEALDGRVERYTFDAAYPSLAAYLQTLPPEGPRVVLACGLDALPDEARLRALRYLNRERETLARSGRSVVLFIRPQTVQDLTFQAGDFWSWRSGFYEFEAPPDEPARREALAALRLSLPATLEGLRRRYLDYIVAAYRWLDLRGLMQVRNLVRLPLAQVYTPLSAIEEIIMKSKEHRSRKVMSWRVGLAQTFRQYRQIVLLGDPGSGKSTFLRYVALACAEGPEAARERLGLGDAPLPILIPLAAYVLAVREKGVAGRGEPAEITLEEFLPLYFQGLGLPDLAPLFAYCLEEGRAILLLDGLDEVTSADERRRVADAVMTLAAKYPRCRFVVTSRIAGYEAAPLSDTFARLTLAPFEREDIQRFAHQWSLAYEAAGLEPETLPPEVRKRAEARAEDLFAAVTSHPSIERLAVNPLLLTILALIHYQGTRLPHRRVELYRLCVEALAETWNLARSLSGRPIDLLLGERRLDERTVVGILAPIAFWMHQERPGGLATREDLISRLTATPSHLTPIPYRLTPSLASDFLDLAREQMGLLMERGQGQFGFVHLTLQEYLAARYIAMQEEPFALLRPYLHNPRWQEVALLTACILGDFSPAYATRFVRAILEAGHLPLALRILADDVPMEEALAEEVVSRAVRLLCSACSMRLRDEITSGLGALEGGLYQSLAVPHLLAAMRDESWQVRQAAAGTLGRLGRATDEVLAALIAALRDESWQVRQVAARALGRLGRATDEVLAVLMAALQDENSSVRREAAGALERLDRATDEVLAALTAALRDKDGDVQRAAAVTLGRLGRATDEVLAALTTALRDKSWRVRWAAAEALGELGLASDEVPAVLINALRDEDTNVRWSATWTLGRLSRANQKALAALIDALRDENTDVRWATAWVLGESGQATDEVLAALRSALQDETPFVRRAAVGALGRLGRASDEVLAMLTAALRDEDADVRRAAAWALGYLGRVTDEALAVLAATLRDENEWVRSSAAETLRELGWASFSHPVSYAS